CDQKVLIDILRRRDLWDGEVFPAPRSRRAPARTEPDPDAIARIESAVRIWNAGNDPRGTLVAAYLKSRGLDLPPAGRLRFHTALSHSKGGCWPAMVALVTDVVDKPIGLHRTFLARDGSG